MIPKPVKCNSCGGFTGMHQFTDEDVDYVTGWHNSNSECIEHLSQRISELHDMFMDYIESIQRKS